MEIAPRLPQPPPTRWPITVYSPSASAVVYTENHAIDRLLRGHEYRLADTSKPSTVKFGATAASKRRIGLCHYLSITMLKWSP
jgi:hypothetical protein